MTEKNTIRNDKNNEESWGEISVTPRFDKEKLRRGFTRVKSNVTWWSAYADLESEKVIQIESAVRGEEYYCPECGGAMIPKKGDILAHHFSHKPKIDGTSHSCVGEGNRHFRVKSFLHDMLNATKNHHFRYDIKVEMERRIDNDQPDIVVRFKQQDILAIEIVDTNPPSKEKKMRWKDRMFEIEISDWGDDVLIDAAKLSGLLIPRILLFQRLTDRIVTQDFQFLDSMKSLELSRKKVLQETKNNIETFRVEQEQFQNDEMERIESNLQKKLHEWKKIRETPMIWSGSWTKELEEHERTHNQRFGAWVNTDSEGYDSLPSSGDYVLIKNRNGGISLGILGEAFTLYPTDSGLMKFRLIRTRRAQEMTWFLRELYRFQINS